MTEDQGLHETEAGASQAAPPAGSGLATLSEEECWKRLRSRDLGRIAVIAHGLPAVYPVNYAVTHDSVLFRTAPGAKLDGAHRAAVCFQVDSWDERTGTGWSVMVQGFARAITSAADPLWAEVQDLRVYPAAPGVRPIWIAVHGDRISGRYFSAGPMAPPLPLQRQ